MFAREGLWAVGEAVQGLLPPAISPAFVAGMTGGVARAVEETPAFSDIDALLLPGLAALGIRAELAPLPEEETALLRFLNERLRRGVPVPVFAFAEDAVDSVPGPPQAEELIDAENGEEVSHDVRLGPMTQQGLAQSIRRGDAPIIWRNRDDQEAEENCSAFRTRFTHALRLLRAKGPGQRRANIQSALLRWLAFSAAFPEQLPTADVKNRLVLGRAAAFLREVAGRKRSPVTTRLRRAAECFGHARTEEDIHAALHILKEAVLLDVRLPALAQEALLSPPHEPLSDLARRELIYLARAGTRDIKTLAARRLVSERRHPDVRATLDQLTYAPDTWVRATVTSSVE